MRFELLASYFALPLNTYIDVYGNTRTRLSLQLTNPMSIIDSSIFFFPPLFSGSFCYLVYLSESMPVLYLPRYGIRLELFVSSYHWNH